MPPPEQQTPSPAPQKWFSFLAGLFETKSEPEKQRDNHQPPPPAGLGVLSIRSSDERSEISAADLAKSYSRPPAEYNDPMWLLGWTDGKSGQATDVNEKLLEAHARIEWNRGNEEAEEQVAKSTHEVEVLKQEKQTLEKEQTLVSKNYDDLSQQRADRFQDFSRKQAWGYLVFGIVTLIADLPLSLRLVATGFGVKTSALVNGVELRADDILSANFFQVVQHFWEAIILALGIAFGSILIKYFFDIFVFRSPTDQTSPVMRTVSIVALLLFVVTTVCLGVFRHEIQPQVEKFEWEQTRERIKEQKIEDKAKELLVGFADESEPIVKARTEAKRIVELKPEKALPNFYSAWGLPTFIFLTLLFPVVSGICFSVSGKKLRNAYLYDSLEARRKELNLKLGDTEKSLSQKSGELAAYQIALAVGKSPQSEQDLAQRLRYLYLHGYDRGTKNVPETVDSQEGSAYQFGYKSVQRLLDERMRKKR